MRTTLNLDDDVLAAVRELARLRGRSAGEVLSSLARDALSSARGRGAERNGIPLLPSTGEEGIVTPEIVDRLEGES